MSQVEKAMDVALGLNLPADFKAAALDIVRQARNGLCSVLNGEPRKELENLRQAELDKVAEMVVRSFAERKMGLRELGVAAWKELAIVAIKKGVRKYSVDLMSQGGIGPTEYFDRFYKEYFVTCRLPANGISIIDPNLHTQLNKRHEFPIVSRLLVRETDTSAAPAP